MGVIDSTENADKYNNSRELTGQLTNSIKQQEHRYTVSDENIKSCKSSIKKKGKDKTLIFELHCESKCPVNTKDLTILAKNKAVQAGLLYYLLSNSDFHCQKQNSGMQSIYDISFH